MKRREGMAATTTRKTENKGRRKWETNQKIQIRRRSKQLTHTHPHTSKKDFRGYPSRLENGHSDWTIFRQRSRRTAEVWGRISTWDKYSRNRLVCYQIMSQIIWVEWIDTLTPDRSFVVWQTCFHWTRLRIDDDDGDVQRMDKNRRQRSSKGFCWPFHYQFSSIHFLCCWQQNKNVPTHLDSSHARLAKIASLFSIKM